MNANNASINSGGQCSDGLRMIIVIGEVTLPTVPATAPAGMVASTIPPSQRPVATGISGVYSIDILLCINSACACCEVHAWKQSVTLLLVHIIRMNLHT